VRKADLSTEAVAKVEGGRRQATGGRRRAQSAGWSEEVGLVHRSGSEEARGRESGGAKREKVEPPLRVINSTKP